MRVHNLYILYYLKNRDIKEKAKQNKTQRFLMKAFTEEMNEKKPFWK